jgi:hypothetical protein
MAHGCAQGAIFLINVFLQLLGTEPTKPDDFARAGRKFSFLGKGKR